MWQEAWLKSKRFWTIRSTARPGLSRHWLISLSQESMRRQMSSWRTMNALNFWEMPSWGTWWPDISSSRHRKMIFAKTLKSYTKWRHLWSTTICWVWSWLKTRSTSTWFTTRKRHLFTNSFKSMWKQCMKCQLLKVPPRSSSSRKRKSRLQRQATRMGVVPSFSLCKSLISIHCMSITWRFSAMSSSHWSGQSSWTPKVSRQLGRFWSIWSNLMFTSMPICQHCRTTAGHYSLKCGTRKSTRRIWLASTIQKSSKVVKKAVSMASLLTIGTAMRLSFTLRPSQRMPKAKCVPSINTSTNLSRSLSTRLIFYLRTNSVITAFDPRKLSKSLSSSGRKRKPTRKMLKISWRCRSKSSHCNRSKKMKKRAKMSLLAILKTKMWRRDQMLKRVKSLEIHQELCFSKILPSRKNRRKGKIEREQTGMVEITTRRRQN